MKQCAQCSADLPDEARFCLNCGARQDNEASPATPLNGTGAAAQGTQVKAAGERAAAGHQYQCVDS